MRKIGFASALLGLVFYASAAVGGDEKGTSVDFDGLKSQTPPNWKQQQAGNKFRVYQFAVPPAGTDKDSAEVVVFHFPGGGGSVKDNIKRWKSQFAAPEGKTIDDIAKVETLEVSKIPVTYLDVAGTYLFKAAPFDPNARVERKESYRMIGVVFESQNGSYFIRFVGPAHTIAENKQAFDGWLKGFK